MSSISFLTFATWPHIQAVAKAYKKLHFQVLSQIMLLLHALPIQSFQEFYNHQVEAHKILSGFIGIWLIILLVIQA